MLNRFRAIASLLFIENKRSFRHINKLHSTPKMSTLENLTSKACCTIPPVLSDYTPKGTKQAYGGLNVYVTGPETSENAIVCVFDIFGYIQSSPLVLPRLTFLHAAGSFRKHSKGLISSHRA